MFPNYYPFYTYPRPSIYANNTQNINASTTQTLSTSKNINDNTNNNINEKKDIVNDTIPFENYLNSNPSNTKNNDKKTKSRFFNFNKQEISFGNITLQTDDLIIMGIIILLFIESEDNMLLIIVLGLLLLNINLDDIFSLF